MSKVNKVLLVTGASSDIGVGFIRKNINEYQTIIAQYRTDNEELIELATNSPERIILRKCDFSSLEETRLLADSFGVITPMPTHFLHLPSIPFASVKFPKTDWKMFKDEFSVSFRSATILSQAILPKMAKAKYGKVVYMLTSFVINKPATKYATPYTTSKYALLGLMNCLAAEYSDKNICVNGVSPSIIETSFLEKTPQLVIELNAEASPIKRNLQVDDVLPTIEFLLSSDSDCVTGQNIPITGGN